MTDEELAGWRELPIETWPVEVLRAEVEAWRRIGGEMITITSLTEITGFFESGGIDVIPFTNQQRLAHYRALAISRVRPLLGLPANYEFPDSGE